VPLVLIWKERDSVVVSLRCTAKLLKKMKMDSPGEPPASTTALGDWFANIIYTRQGHYIILVSEKSRLPILLSAKGLDSFESRFIRMLREQLIKYGASEKAADLEISHMHPMHYGKTNSRSVLGTINDFTLSFRYMLPYRQNYTNYDWSDNLAETPCSPIGYGLPRELAVELVMQRVHFRVIEGGSD
jgi:hypothetical protein